MRTIKFRGKKTNNGEWIYGGYVNQTDLYGTLVNVHYIIDGTVTIDYDMGEIYQVQPETIGQYTGLKDKNGVEIYEGDLIRELGLKETWTLSRRDEFSERKHVVMWDEEQLQWCGNLYEQSVLEIYEMDTRPLEFLCKKYTIEVIGNIHEVAQTTEN